MYAVGLEKDTPGPVLRELPKPFIEAEDQVLVKVLQAGIDGTDRNMIRYGEKDLPLGEDFITAKPLPKTTHLPEQGHLS